MSLLYCIKDTKFRYLQMVIFIKPLTSDEQSAASGGSGAFSVNRNKPENASTFSLCTNVLKKHLHLCLLELYHCHGYIFCFMFANRRVHTEANKSGIKRGSYVGGTRDERFAQMHVFVFRVIVGCIWRAALCA